MPQRTKNMLNTNYIIRITIAHHCLYYSHSDAPVRLFQAQPLALSEVEGKKSPLSSQTLRLGRRLRQLFIATLYTIEPYRKSQIENVLILPAHGYN
jgi:hypothetical protein